MMSKFQQFVGFGSSTGGTGGPNNGEGLSDMQWKKKENKYQGLASIGEKETKDDKDLRQVDMYTKNFPNDDKFLGFENVSFHM